jgi:hypothetical protein
MEKMRELVESGVRIEKGFKEVHQTVVIKTLLKHLGIDVIYSSTQVHNHLRKYKVNWLTITITRLRDLSGAQCCKETKCIILEADQYHGHVSVSILSSTIVLFHH